MPTQPFDDEAPTTQRAKLAECTDELEMDDDGALVNQFDDEEERLTRSRPPPFGRV